MIYKCPICGVIAEVQGRNISVRFEASPGGKGRAWPRHADCELGKDIDSIDWKKLERVS